MAVKTAHDLGLFTALAQATSPLTLAELAEIKSADPLLVGQFEIVSFSLNPGKLLTT